MSVMDWALAVLLGFVVFLWGGLWVLDRISAWRHRRDRERLTWR